MSKIIKVIILYHVNTLITLSILELEQARYLRQHVAEGGTIRFVR